MLSRVGRILKRRGLAGTVIMLADRVTRPFGLSLISFSRLGALPPPEPANSSRSKFDQIASGNLWGSSESLSGAGSEVSRTRHYREALVELVRERCFRSLFDAPSHPLGQSHLLILLSEEGEKTHAGQ